MSLFPHDKKYASSMIQSAPKTFKQLQIVVMTMADVSNNHGKKSFFGGDKGEAALKFFNYELGILILKIWKEDLVAREVTVKQMHQTCGSQINVFLNAFPGWDDARKYSYDFFSPENEHVLKIVKEFMVVLSK